MRYLHSVMGVAGVACGCVVACSEPYVAMGQDDATGGTAAANGGSGSDEAVLCFDACPPEDVTELPVTTEAGRAFVGSSTIPVRHTNVALPTGTVPRLEYRTWSDVELLEWLATAPVPLLGEPQGTLHPPYAAYERGGVYGDLDAFSISFTHAEEPQELPILSTVECANVALELVAQAGIWELEANETLEFIANSIVAGGLTDPSSEAGPNGPIEPGSSTPVFSYRVSFGYRYRSVAVLDGGIEVAFRSGASAPYALDYLAVRHRSVVREHDPPIELLTPEELEAAGNPEYQALAPVARRKCGYSWGENAGADDTQTTYLASPGVGCFTVYDAPDDPYPELRDTVNASTTGEPPLGDNNEYFSE